MVPCDHPIPDTIKVFFRVTALKQIPCRTGLIVSPEFRVPGIHSGLLMDVPGIPELPGITGNAHGYEIFCHATSSEAPEE